MKSSNFYIFDWLYNAPYRGLERAYKASKKARYVQTIYENYIQKATLKYSWYNIYLYINAVLDEAFFDIYWGLIEFQCSTFVFNNFISIFFLRKPNFSTNNKTKGFPDFEKLPNYLQKPVLNTSNKVDLINRKIIWIEAALIDLKAFRKKCSTNSIEFQKQKTQQNNSNSNFQNLATQKNITYESVGLVPRSITRTLSRFQIELAGRSSSLVIPEFQLTKYQVTTSVQYMVFLVCFPWLFSFFCKLFIFQPLINYYWNTKQHQIFLNSLQQEAAFKRLQEIEELLWLDIVITNNSKTQLQNFAIEIQQKTIFLVNEYNLNSIQILLHLVTNFLSFGLVTCILLWGKKRLTILNSWIQELFYSLSDTMKSFFILLLTDLCIGFHSPHGWEIAISFLLEYLGFSHNKHLISCFVSTFPVILDTVFKYWIFRHLNRISPSIVVTYHAMNE
uniref:Potassium/proton antiporter CemA n=1 Tax=Cylindrocystis brebissonii TaxID=102167 RepID=A0A191T625_9VIRI|nr:chloroplast enveloppe membrane protein [Cylindrocystis brebissonii]ANI25827.1 chloroplast enveloppe membrane protein [Cylindrocystis brebissonii]